MSGGSMALHQGSTLSSYEVASHDELFPTIFLSTTWQPQEVERIISMLLPSINFVLKM